MDSRFKRDRQMGSFFWSIDAYFFSILARAAAKGKRFEEAKSSSTRYFKLSALKTERKLDKRGFPSSESIR
jgi:hypothetical protein